MSWWRPSAITPPDQRLPLFSLYPPSKDPPLEPVSEADELRTAGKAPRHIVVDEDASDTPSAQGVLNALAADEADDADEVDPHPGLEMGVDSDDEGDAAMTDEEEEHTFKTSAKDSGRFKEWTAETLRRKCDQSIPGRLVRMLRETPPWHRPIPDPEFPGLVAAVQQDNNDKSKQACIDVFGSKNDDCSVHLGRHLEPLLVGKNKRPAPEAPSVLERLQRDFNRIKNVPTLPLLWLCCHLFVIFWMVTQPRMAKYFLEHAFVFRWTRVQVGAGCGSDNNPLEGTNRTQKDAVHWTRHALLKFGEVMRHWL
mmetsp:Transcript_49700/g.113782  ORF Transcript_49700/g.113782 Transcript_49700/m.113782 type:complete len:310 (+) Transcript_49700:90-1019(+)